MNPQRQPALCRGSTSEKGVETGATGCRFSPCNMFQERTMGHPRLTCITATWHLPPSPSRYAPSEHTSQTGTSGNPCKVCSNESSRQYMSFSSPPTSTHSPSQSPAAVANLAEKKLQTKPPHSIFSS